MDGSQAAFEATEQERRVRFSKIGCVLALALVPAGSSLDFFIYPDYFSLFVVLRLVCDILIALLFALHYTAIGIKHIRSLTFAWLLVVQITICAMIYVTDGYESSYYAGLNLTILGMGILLPTTLSEAILFCGATLGLYVGSCSANALEGVDNRIAFNNIYFLVLTGIISSTAVFYNWRRRLMEFRLNFNLDMRNKQLAEMDRLKSEFFANISHELRTPLTLILAPVEDLLQGGQRLSDKVAIPLGIVRSNALRLLKLVNELLELIRLEEGKSRLREQPVEVTALLSGLTDSMSNLAQARSIELIKALDEAPLTVKGDPRALEKIVINLLNNALKFTEPGGRVEVHAGIAGELVEIRIADTGIGIPAPDLPHIFDRFHQVDGSSTRKYQGTGLGLALVKELTEKQGGRVEVHSRPGHGTVMSVLLPPFVPQQADAPTSSDEAEPMQSEPGTVQGADPLADVHRLAERSAGLSLDAPFAELPEDVGQAAAEDLATALVVDDEPDMRRYLGEVLAREYRVLEARDGSEGLERALEFRPDLVLLDLMLPKIDGLEVCRRLKQDPSVRHTKVMLLTARVDEQAKLTALEHGADDFLTKPFSSLEVKTRLRNLLRTARLQQDLEHSNAELRETLAELKSTQAQLIHSEKLNALGSMAAGLLHEINNPLNFTLTAIQIARAAEVLDEHPELEEIFADIEEGMERIKAIVSDLRAFAYPKDAEMEGRFDFGSALESALHFTAREHQGLRIERDLPAGATVIGSKSHIVQVLVNLIGNAAKAVAPVLSERPGVIEVLGEIHNGRLLVRVRDNGIGMDAETLERIFDPFFTTRDVGEGTGLGLSISHTIIKNHGGSLRASSEPGQGSELVFDLAVAPD
jgi:signal transduction histidine kinase